MKNSLRQQLLAARAKTAQLEEAYNKEQSKVLLSLPRAHGYENAEELITALRNAHSNGSRAKTSTTTAKVGKRKKGKRAKITPETKSRLKDLVSEGKTGATIAKELGISLPSV